MALRDNKAPEKKSFQIPAYPEICQRFDCEEPTGIAILYARRGDGKVIGGSFSQLAFEKRHGDAVSREMKHGYEFVGWVTRCARCYLEDQRSRNRQQEAA